MKKDTIDIHSVTRTALHTIAPGQSLTFELEERGVMQAQTVIPAYNRYYGTNIKGRRDGMTSAGLVRYTITHYKDKQ